MRRLLAIMAIALLGLLAPSVHETRAAPAQAVPPPRVVILIHGWVSWFDQPVATWDTAKAAYEAHGDTVYVLRLPDDGNNSSATNAIATNTAYIENFIATNHLTNVQLDGHSLGGWEVLNIVLIKRDPAVVSAVLRDTITCTSGNGCPSAAFLASLQGLQSPVPVLAMNHLTDALPGVDCLRVYPTTPHNDFKLLASFTTIAEAWPAVNPCAAQPSPTPSPVPSPTPTPPPVCQWWQRLFGICR